MSGADGTLLGATVFGAVGTALGLMMLAAGDRTRANLGIGFAFVFLGPVIPLANHVAGNVGGGIEPLARLTVLLTAGATWATAAYLSGLAVTSHASPERVRRVRTVVMAICVLGGVLAVVGLVSPGTYLNDVVLHLLEPGARNRLGVWIFVPLYVVMTVLFMYAYYLLFRGPLDPGERARAICAFISSPMLIASQFGTRESMLALAGTAMMTSFYGIYRNAIAQGERGAFLSRFLSPQVAEQVRVDGLTTVMKPGDVVLTVVACDLRGFTAYADAVPSQTVIDLLNEYYDAVGGAVGEVGGTIKDYAGDGVLILVGAPLPRADHAAAGLSLCYRIHEVTGPVIERWSTSAHPLGLGVGAATGRVTVGAIGSAARMEYTAVGTPVNLAARLCATAAAGETLVDGQLASAAGLGDLEPREPVRLKGFDRDVPVFATSAPVTVR